ncbi:MAG: hypothetical protein CMI29_04565 [Opitutae bacterium]|nr:hypothetical protein [Opitutae bacterium]|tara:strand:- start:1874 stop:3307 length:1434 start_codon:yes stop_codon:yes gene_type:complete
MLTPNLSRLAHRPSPTGVGPPRTRARALEAQVEAQAAVLDNSDLLAQILAALNTEFGPDDACAAVMSYCAARRGACAEDTWRALLALVFPDYDGTSTTPKAKFLALCRRWDRGRKFRYEHDLAKHRSRIPLGGLVPLADVARILDWFSNTHNYIAEDDETYQNYLWLLPPSAWDNDYDNYGVWYLVNYFAMDSFERISQMLHGGLIHVSNIFATPPVLVYRSDLDRFLNPANWDEQDQFDYNAPDIRFGNPRTLLGFLLVKRERVAYVESLLRTYGADPNEKLWLVEHLSFGEHNTPEEHLNYDEQGAAECLAQRHIYAMMRKKLNRQFTKRFDFNDVNPYELTTERDAHLNEDLWFDKKVQEVFSFPGSMTIRGERSQMLDYFKLLYKYGGDVYNAAMMYRAYSLEFHDFCMRDMANHIETFARYVTMAEGTVPITDALREWLLAKHRALLRLSCPFYIEPDRDQEYSTDGDGIEG